MELEEVFRELNLNMERLRQANARLEKTVSELKELESWKVPWLKKNGKWIPE